MGEVICNCESMGGRFGAHREECPQRIAFLGQVREEGRIAPEPLTDRPAHKGYPSI